MNLSLLPPSIDKIAAKIGISSRDWQPVYEKEKLLCISSKLYAALMKLIYIQRMDRGVHYGTMIPTEIMKVWHVLWRYEISTSYGRIMNNISSSYFGILH